MCSDLKKIIEDDKRELQELAEKAKKRLYCNENKETDKSTYDARRVLKIKEKNKAIIFRLKIDCANNYKKGVKGMDVKSRVIIISALRFDIKNDDGSFSRGVSLQYYPDENMLPYVDSERNGAKGKKAIDDTLPFEMFDELKAVPGLYDVSFVMSSSKNVRMQTKAQLKMKSALFVSDLTGKK